MPEFNKIDGMLAAEMPADEAAMHQAIKEVNVAIDEGDSQRTLEAINVSFQF